MTSIDGSSRRATSHIGAYASPILIGLLILTAGLAPWTFLAQLNATIRPELPWAALATVAYLAILLAWLSGWGPPKPTSELRRQRVREQSPASGDVEGVSAGAIVALLALMYLMWIGISLLSPPPDLGAYPTTAHRWSLFIMGGVTAGVVEEVAFRGYMQRGIETHDRRNALWITSAVFVASHVTQGIGAVLVMAPGLFVVSMLYGMLARRTGSILPGIVIHVLGDLARTYFGVLRGDGSLLFVV